MQNHQYFSDNETVDRQITDILEEQLTANLEMVAPEPVRVSIVEQIEDGKIHPRIATINTFVPMSAFNLMLLSRQRATKEARRQKIEIMKQSDGSAEMREALQEEAKEAEQSIMSKWLLEQVWTIWKRTEKDMTLERLEDGLTFKQIMGLFNRFFEDLIQSRLNRDKARLIS